MGESNRAVAERDAQTMLAEGATDLALVSLPAGEWTVLHDVAWPGRRRAIIDRVVVGPSGIYVLTTKSWSGPVEYLDGVLTYHGRKRRSALRSALAAAAAVASVWPDLPPAAVHGVLCLTGRDRPTASFCCGSVCSTDTLAQTLTSRPAVLTPEQVRTIVSDLRWLLSSAAEPRRLGSVSR